MRIIVDIVDWKRDRLSYICERCGTQLEKLAVGSKTLHHPSHDYTMTPEGYPIQCEDAGSYCDKPEIVFTATSRNEP